MPTQYLSVQEQGFEAGIGSWVVGSNCTIAQSAAQAQAGTKSLAITSSAGGDMACTTSNMPIVAGRSYTVSGYARTAVSARTVRFELFWFQADGVTASTIRSTDQTNLVTDASGSWTGSSPSTFVAPSDAANVQFRVRVLATGAGAEVHYVDTLSLQDLSAPYFKSGRLFEVLMNSLDVSGYFFSSAWNAYVETAEVSTAKTNSGWRSYLSGDAFSQWVGYGYFDSALTGIRSTIQVLPSTTAGILSYAPAGASAIGDQVRLLSFNTSDYKETSRVKNAVAFQWSVESTAPAGIGVTLHPLASENVGTITGTGDGVLTSAAGTGFIAHLHVTAYTAGTHQFKLQDATSLNGAYADIAGGAFTNMTAVGAQRLTVVGTVRQFVRCVAVIGTAAATYSVSVSRFPT